MKRLRLSLTLFLLLLLQLFGILRSDASKTYGNNIFSSQDKPSFLGHTITSAGDVNGDGIKDVMFVKPFEESQIVLLFGGDQWQNNKIRNLDAKNLKVGEDCITIETHLNFRQFLSSAGDFNKDKYDDVLFRGIYKGLEAVFVLFGKSNLQSIDVVNWQESSGIIFLPRESNDLLGFHLKSAGDINGDKHTDIIIGKGNVENSGDFVRPSFFFIIFGTQRTLLPPVLTLDKSTIHSFGIYIEVIESTPYNSGHDFSSVGDLDRDGYDDLAIGDPPRNLVWILFGHKQFSNLQLDTENPNLPQNTLRVFGNSSSHEFGYSVTAAGDYNGDGYLDIFIRESSKVHLVLGTQNWKFDRHILPPFSLEPMGTTLLTFDFHSLHYSHIQHCSDVNGDGLTDTFFYEPNNDEFFLIYGKYQTTKEIDIFNLGNDGLHFEINYRANTISISCDSDIDNDGLIDILYSDPSRVHATALTYFISGKELRIDTNYLHEVSAFDGCSLNGIYSLVTIGDFNGDGLEDAIGLPTAYIDSTKDFPFMYYMQGRTTNLIRKDLHVDAMNSQFFGFPGVTPYNFFSIVKGALHDMNGDGLADFYISNANFRFDLLSTVPKSLYIIFGMKTVPPAVNLSDSSPSNPVEMSRVQGFDSDGVQYFQFSSTDFNGDGLMDCIILGRFVEVIVSHVIVIFGKHSFPSQFDVKTLPDLTFLRDNNELLGTEGFWFSVPQQSFSLILPMIDINGDGKFDLIFNLAGTLSYFLLGSKEELPAFCSHTNGHISLFVLYTGPTNEQITSITTSDLDQDGVDDLIYWLDIQKGSVRTRQIMIEFGSTTKFNNLQCGNQTATVTLDEIRIDVKASHTTTLVMTDIDGDGLDDFVFVEKSSIAIRFTPIDFKNAVRNVSSLPRIDLMISSSDTTISFQPMGNFDNDSFPDYFMGFRIIPGNLLAPYYPARLPSSPPSSISDEFHAKSFFEKYLRALIQELIFIVIVLVMGIVLFLAITGCKSRDRNQPARKRRKERIIEMKKLSEVEEMRSITEEENEEQARLMANH